MAAIEVLPEEMLQKIFSHLQHVDLYHVSVVCQKWYRLAMDPIYWKNIQFKHTVSISKICLVLARMEMVTYLNISGRDELTSHDIRDILLQAPSLKALNMGFIPNIGRDVIQVISDLKSNLEYLNVEGSKLVDTHCLSLLINFKSLSSLNISHCTSLYDFHVYSLVSNLPCLKHLNIDGIECVSDDTVKKIWQCCGSWLESLSLDGAELTDKSVKYLSRCTELKSFEISFGEGISDRGFSYIGNWPNIRDLRIRKANDLSSTGIGETFKTSDNLKQLEKLDLSECSFLMDDGVFDILCRCKKLKSLNLSWCWHITEISLDYIIERCPYLTHLNLTGLDKIQGNHLLDIPKKIPHLELMDLTQCNKINDSVVEQLISEMPSLIAYNYYGVRF